MDCNGLQDVVSSGCDERLFLNPKTGRNKYYLNPLDFHDVHYRGSCTCGSLTPFTQPIAVSALQRIQCSGQSELDQWAQEQCDRLQQLIGDNVAFDVFFGPSGSDLLYLPLLFQKVLSRQPLLNIVSCPEELGSGSNLAAEGRYHSENGPFDDFFEKGEQLSSDLNPRVVRLGARSTDGRIRSRHEEVHQVLSSYPGHSAIVNLVYGSKSGIEDDLNIIDPERNVLWTVDLCQFRADPLLIQELLAKGAMVLITGSKFYNAPPFCGALLVPCTWTDRLRGVDVSAFAMLSKIFARNDIPGHLEHVRQQFCYGNNSGLRLRWDCALAEMEAYDRLDKEKANQVIQSWNQAVLNALGEAEFFELMPDQEATNASIISFRVISGGEYFSHEELQALFASFVQREFANHYSFSRVFIGQPVRYGDRSFIRFALGSWAVRQLANTAAQDWRAEYEMVDDLACEVDAFERGR